MQFGLKASGSRNRHSSTGNGPILETGTVRPETVPFSKRAQFDWNQWWSKKDERL